MQKVLNKQFFKGLDMSGVLILSTDKKKAILTKQFLYPIHIKVKEPILKIVTEKMDVGE